MDFQALAGFGGIAVATLMGASVAYNALQGDWEPITYMPVDYQNQSILLDEAEGIRGSALRPDGGFTTSPGEGIVTVYDCFHRGMALAENEPCLGWRRDGKSSYEWITYSETHRQARAIGSAMVQKFDLKVNGETCVCICAKNCKEWIITQLGCCMFSQIVVPLYETLGNEGVSQILQQTESEVLFYESNKMVQQMVNNQTQETLSHVKHIVLFESVQKETVQILQQKCPEAKMYSFQDMLEYGTAHPRELQLPSPDNLYSICYTSGTTGAPKGVMILHKNLVACLASNVVPMVQSGIIELSKKVVHFSYLPLAHMFEQLAQACIFMYGGRVGLFRGDVRGLLDDITELRPTFFCTVPRILNRIYDKVMTKANSTIIGRYLIKKAIQEKLSSYQKGYNTRNTIWDKLVLNKVRDILGGRVEVLISGSAPLAPEVKEFFLAIYGCSFYEGYGQTEATAAVAGTLPGDFNVGHVGCVAPCCHLKLADVPNMGLDWRRDGKGEICIRGPVCTPGYWKMPEKTKELYDEDGWLHTGDIGSWMPNGTIKIVDRCKNIFKLAQGEYVSPEKVEMFLVQSPYVAQICVDGNSLMTFCVAIVVPDFENLLDPKLANNVEEQRKLCEDSDGSLYRKILDSLTEMAKKGKLNGFEMVKDIHITTEPFSITNDLLTPTMKLRRGAIRDHYSTEIEKLYARHSTPNA